MVTSPFHSLSPFYSLPQRALPFLFKAFAMVRVLHCNPR